MRKYELTIAKNYVPEWGIREAVRELFQNALDQEVISEDNKMFFSYSEGLDVLEIGNKNSTLEASSLLLGTTTKLNDNLTIGQFGEGYKIAMLILLRNNLRVTIYNYGNREIWKPRFVKSRKYKAEILTVFSENASWNKKPENSLIIRIEGISKAVYDDIFNYNLHLRGIKDYCISEGYGKLLKDEDLKGMIFVNGLFVTENQSFDYGYDFLPSKLRLKRDRSMVDNFDLKTATANLWDNLAEDEKQSMASMIVSGSSDLSYISYSHVDTSSVSKDVFNVFKEQHGENSIALSNNTDLKSFMESHPDVNPIVVSDTLYDIIKKDERYLQEIDSFYKEIDRSPVEKLEIWFTELVNASYLNEKVKKDFNDILLELKFANGIVENVQEANLDNDDETLDDFED